MIPQPLSSFRAAKWSTIPTTPGVYWWYFPLDDLDRLGISKHCDVSQLRLRQAPDGKVCLYHGMANNLAERVGWHAAQKLGLSSLRSGFLSTFRLSLLALNDYDYFGGDDKINAYFDRLSVAYQSAATREDAEAIEHEEFNGGFHFPINLMGNRRPELVAFRGHLKSLRRAYKSRFS
jgi:hypothetical protein